MLPVTWNHSQVLPGGSKRTLLIKVFSTFGIMCSQQRGEKWLQREFILGDTTEETHTLKTKCDVKSATLHYQLAGSENNWEKYFFSLLSLQKMKASLPHLSWFIPFLQTHICQAAMMLWDTVKPYHKVYFSLTFIWIIRLINCSTISPSPWTYLSFSWQRWPLVWTEDPWECNVDIIVKFIRSSLASLKVF